MQIKFKKQCKYKGFDTLFLLSALHIFEALAFR